MERWRPNIGLLAYGAYFPSDRRPLLSHAAANLRFTELSAEAGLPLRSAAAALVASPRDKFLHSQTVMKAGWDVDLLAASYEYSCRPCTSWLKRETLRCELAVHGIFNITFLITSSWVMPLPSPHVQTSNAK